MRLVYPFTAIVGQNEMKSALLAAAVDPGIGGVLILGDRGTGKSTAVRALAALLPDIPAVDGCRFGCDPAANGSRCEECHARLAAGERLRKGLKRIPVVDLPLGATEDRVVGALDLERALSRGERALEPGLLARAHRGFLYVDEVNLLEDHLVDLLLDVAATGENVIERDGLSLRHPARFVLVGSGNPEEGELRPQLLDRFGLAVSVATPRDLEARVEVVKRRDAFDREPAAFAAQWARAEGALRRRIVVARRLLASVEVPDSVMTTVATLCAKLETDGLRGELTMLRVMRAVAALDGETRVRPDHVWQVAAMALGHRLRRDPLDETRTTVRVARAVDELRRA